ncbi:YdcF family protein [Kribbella sp. CA-293567]|uniref:YdcF family protein n=1 Tax=Kribbella sp. CA-293567 TaxID=3002436 RepID=UPI0022DE9108|nr:YdcF family protein [Kribbella sp. CA-293567]WBQ03668.1 YdcF family protein [Kribbella sp. CA-293567]
MELPEVIDSGLVIPFGISGFWFLLFLITWIRDRRVLRNGVFLVLALMFAGIGTVFLIDSVYEPAANFVVFAVLVAIPLTIFVLAIFLTANGVTMWKREGHRPANLLSLLAGTGIIAFVGFNVIVQQLSSPALETIRATLIGMLTYVSFLFVCFLAYSFVYARVRLLRKVDFIVVLGSGLRGSRVPPLLASRLDRARTAWQKEHSKGRTPLLITSGGQGPGEDVPESHAMAVYLVERGVPADQILLEDESRSTFQNLTFSGRLMAGLNPKYRCLIVTNNYHALRAAFTARKAKVNGQVLGAPTAAYFWPSATIREFVAVLADHKWINGGVLGLIALSGLGRLVF